jgi:single-strand DNA-binding protein
MSETITITGNVGTDPQLKHTQDGLAIASFRVGSTQRRYDRSSSKWVDAGTSWYAVSAFRSLAEHAHASLKRGDRVVLTGRLRVRNWDNGTARGTAVEIDAEAIGHDLLWGTSVFTKTARDAGAPRIESWDTTSPVADDWARPGAPEAFADESTDAGESRELELSAAAQPF